jgi:hypothetical protein
VWNGPKTGSWIAQCDRSDDGLEIVLQGLAEIKSSNWGWVLSWKWELEMGIGSRS